MIMLYGKLFCQSSTWRFHVILFVASNSGKTNSPWVLWVVRKSPHWVIHLTKWVFLWQNLVVCFPSTIEEVEPESSRILSVRYLVLPSLPFAYPIITDVYLLDDLSYIITFPPLCLFLALPLHHSTACGPYVAFPQSWGFQIWSAPARLLSRSHLRSWPSNICWV